MDVAWIATDPGPRDLALTETRPDADGFMSRLQHLLGTGEGYAEVRRAEADSPLLTFSFRGDHAVMNLFESPDDGRLLRADGVLPATDTVEVPVLWRLHILRRLRRQRGQGNGGDGSLHRRC